MKDKIIETLTLTLVVTLLTAVTSLLVEDWLGTKGLLQLGNPLVVDARVFLPISLENPRDSAIDGLQLAVPLGAGPTLSSEPIRTEVQESPGSSQSTLVLSGVPPRRRVQLLVGLQSLDQAPMVAVINAQEMRFDVRRSNEVQSSFIKQVLVSAIPNAILYFLFFAIFEVFNSRSKQVLLGRTEALQSEVDGTRRDLETNKNDLKQHRKWIAQLEQRRAQERAILYHRLSHYRDELAFWRDTVRKALSDLAGDRTQAIFRSISATLRTYSTHRDDIDVLAFEEMTRDAGLRQAFEQAALARTLRDREATPEAENADKGGAV